MKKSKPLIWIDLEMTGLNPEYDRIIEIAIVVTDGELNTIAEGPVMAIQQSKAMMDGMDDWNQKHHGQSGLIDRVLASDITEAQAEQAMLSFLAQHVKAGVSPMCGNSVWQDRRFLARYMPQLEAYFHYRLVDVSTLKELAKRWRPALYDGFQKETKHEALADVYESIEELRYYRSCWLEAATSTITGE